MRKWLVFALCLLAASPARADLLHHAPLDSSAKFEEQDAGVRCTCTGAFRFAKGGVREQCLEMAFGGKSGQVTYASAKPLLGTDGSLGFWVFPRDWRGIDRTTPFHINVENDNEWRLAIFKEKTASNLVFLVETKGKTLAYFAPVYDWKNRRWGNITVSRSGGRFEFYFNGQKAAEYRKMPAVPVPWEKDAGFRLTISAAQMTSIDEIRIHDRAFTEEEIEKRYVTSVLEKKEYETPLVRIPYVAEPPSRGGKVDISAWKNAAVVTGFENTLSLRGEVKAERQTAVYLMYDKHRLYLLYESPVPEGGLKGKPTPRDVIETADQIEFFAMPKYTETFYYYQFVGNFLESQYDGRCRFGISWNGKWFYRCLVDENLWRAELWVDDVEPMEVPPPRAGDTWGVNFCRNWVGEGSNNWTIWSQSSGGYHNYKRFGKIVFGNKESAFVRVKEVAEIDGKAHLVAASFEIVNPSKKKEDFAIRYNFYAKDDYLPLSTTKQTVTVDAMRRETVEIKADTKSNLEGFVEVAVKEVGSGELLWRQMLALGK